MGYDLHITRYEHWYETEGPGISLEEWLAYAASDQELNVTNGFARKIGPEEEYLECPGYCTWLRHPVRKEPGEQPRLAYNEGNIETKNPDLPTIRKLMQIASALNAKVVGDDGEVYTEEYLAQWKWPEVQPAASGPTTEKRWWKFW